MGYNMIEYKDRTTYDEVSEMMTILHKIKQHACKALELYGELVDKEMYSERSGHTSRYRDRYDY